MQYRRLGPTDMDVSILSYGASSLGSVFREVPEDEGIATVRRALDLGINLIDVSPYYGMTKAETVLGKALDGVDRDRYYLATKCGRYGATVDQCDYSAARVTRSVDESLSRLGVDHLDIIQVHDVEFGDVRQIVTETLPALDNIRRAGKARYVGITGLPLQLLTGIVERLSHNAEASGIDTILSYCHYELNDTSLLDVVPMLERHGVGVINASPLGMGLLSDRGTPDWHPAPGEVKRLCSRAAEHCRDKGQSLMKLAVQFSAKSPSIPTTLVGTGKPENIEKNVAWIDEPMDEELLAEVREILAPIHNVTWPQGRPENNP